MSAINIERPISGLAIYRNFLTDLEVKESIVEIDKQVWLTDLQRRTQQYGGKYLFDQRELLVDDTVPTLAYCPMLFNLGTKLTPYFHEYGCEQAPNQCIVNEYVRNQRIGAYLTTHKSF